MGRNPTPDSGDRERQQRKVRGFARGHGAHHRYQTGRSAPRGFGTGRDRTSEGTRQKQFQRLHDDELHDLQKSHKNMEGDRHIEESAEAHGYGAELEGQQATGVVLEVRKGNFLTRMHESSPPPSGDPRQPVWKQGDVLRTFVRGTLQQFDLGLSSLVAPGDEIDVIVPELSAEGELVQETLHAVMTRVRPRRNEFRRLHPSGRSIQTLAANVDRVLIVASAGQPEFRPGFVDRVLVCAAACNVPAALVVNKLDLGLPAEDEKLLEVYRKLGLPVLKLSLKDPTAPAGDFAELQQLLRGTRTVLTGHSGVGKSTLLLALDPQLPVADIRVGEVSEQMQKGTHTTTHGHLYPIHLGIKGAGEPQAEVIDTPGVREFTPADTDRRNLWGWFPEIVALQDQCAFPNCTHRVEKGCAILAAVERGEIHPRRHQSYVRIHDTLPT